MSQTITEGVDETMPSINAREILTYDFRTEENKKKKLSEQVNIVQWNIERGIELERIIQELKILLQDDEENNHEGTSNDDGHNHHNTDSGADIIILQELDMFCRRSSYKNVCYEIAKALHLQLVFFCEFEELDSADREPQHCVGPLSVSLPPPSQSPISKFNDKDKVYENARAPTPSHIEALFREGKLRHFHGNAILSKCVTLRQPTVVFHHNSCHMNDKESTSEADVMTTSPYMLNWEKEGERLRQPRHGERGVLRVMISPLDRQATCCTTTGSPPRFTEKDDDDEDKDEDEAAAQRRQQKQQRRRQLVKHSKPVIPPLFIYSCHFEVFCGPLTRVRQYTDIVADARKLVEQYAANVSTTTSAADALPPAFPAFVIAGDLNTMQHNVVRVSPIYCTDCLRFLSFGETEACWWQRKVHGHHKSHIIHGCCPLSYRFPFYVFSNLYDYLFNNAFVWRWLYGFSKEAYDTLFQTEPATIPRQTEKLHCDQHLCFYDPSDKYESVTINIPHYRGMVQGKLDWTLVANCRVLPPRHVRMLTQLRDVGAITDTTALRYIAQLEAEQKQRQQHPEQPRGEEKMPRDGYMLFNDPYDGSDHKGIYICIEQNNNGTLYAADYYPPYGALYTRSWIAISFFALSRAVPLLAIGGGAYYWLKRQKS